MSPLSCAEWRRCPCSRWASSARNSRPTRCAQSGAASRRSRSGGATLLRGHRRTGDTAAPRPRCCAPCLRRVLRRAWLTRVPLERAQARQRVQGALGRPASVVPPQHIDRALAEHVVPDGRGDWRALACRASQRAPPCTPVCRCRLLCLQLTPVLGARRARPQNEDKPEFVTLKARAEAINFMRDESEEDLGLQVSMSLDSMTSLTKVHRRPLKEHHDSKKDHDFGEDEVIELSDEPFLFHMNGSPVGAMLMVKLLGVRRADTFELGSALFDLSTIAVGARAVQVSCELESAISREKKPSIRIELKLCPRRKAFTFSYLREEPLFHCSGYTITANGIRQFPHPYKKNGMPAGVAYANLQVVGKLAWGEDIEGLEVVRAVDGNGGSYTIQKFSIMQTSARNYLVNSLDGLLDALPETTVRFFDAFLVGARVCLVLDERGGVYLRDAIQETGACPEMVASIVLRQVLTGIQYLHEHKSRLHLDIDARNILCLKNGECHLGGFCYSTKHIGRTSNFAGPFYHMSPERLLGLECSFAADVWSIGILAIELALGKGPYDMTQFEGPNALFEFRKMVAEGQHGPSLKGVKGVTDAFRSFVAMCLHKNISRRALPGDLLAHPFIQRYESFLLPAGSWLCKQKKPNVEISFNVEHRELRK